jgi:hypothetical protein
MNICESCKTANIVHIKKEQSQKDSKLDLQYGFHVCKKCDPVMASFAYLTDGYEELRKVLYQQNKEKNERLQQLQEVQLISEITKT